MAVLVLNLCYLLNSRLLLWQLLSLLKNSVTDSAAAGTALATGKKTYNHAISVGEDKNAIQTVAEKAKKSW